MEFLVKLALIVCFTNFVSSSVSPFVNKLETINVLVPQNDRNLRDSVKQLQLDGEDEVLTENDILDISEILPDLDLHKTKKRNRFYNNNKVNDDQNKNNLENKIDVEPQAYFDFASLSGFSPELTTSSYTTTTVAPLNTSQNRTDPNTTEVSNGTVTKTSSSIGNSTLRQTTFTSTPNEPSSTNSTTPALIELTTTESITSKPTTKPPFDSKDYTYKLLDKECVLGTAALYLTWIHENGTLKEDGYGDYSFKFKPNYSYEDFAKTLSETSNEYEALKSVTTLSLANNNLSSIPDEILIIVRSILEYLSLMNNPIQSIDSEVFNNLSSLKELDMRNCHLDSIKDKYFTNLTNLTGLFLSENNILTIEASSFSSLINLRHLDLSHNHNSNKADTLAYIDSGLDINSEALTYMKNLEHLDFSFTKIKSQSFEAFNKLNTNLRNLSLCSTNMPLFLSTMLKKTSALSILDISENSRAVGNNDLDFGLAKDSLEVLFMENCALQSLDFVKNLSKIKVLGLYYNNINVVDNKSVSHLADLDILDLGRNFISNWYEKIFSEEQSLTILNLRNNKISNLTNDMQSDLKHVRIVGLGDNDFECMCSTRHVFNGFFDNTAQFDEFTTFPTETSLDTGASSRIYSKLKHLVIIGREILQKFNIMPYTTLGRNRKDHDVDGSDSFLSQGTILFDYNELSYKCMDDKKKVNIQTICPETYDNNTPAYMKDNNNFVRNIVITVIAVAVFFILSVLIYWKWWYIKYSFILLRNSTILSFLKDEKDPLTESKENTGTEFSYDVFVSYCDENRAWVLDEMLPNIEKREEINICLHERDFQVGYSILENIISCMDKSKVLLLVVSERFLQSHWCQFEMHLAQHRLLETRRDKLILVLLEDIPSRKQSKTLKFLMKTKTYIKWPADPNEIEQRKLFWKRLKKSIISTHWEKDSYGSIC